MAQARTLNSTELQQVLNHVQTRKYAARNQAMLLLTHWAGLRVGEVAVLRLATSLIPMVRSKMRSVFCLT